MEIYNICKKEKYMEGVKILHMADMHLGSAFTRLDSDMSSIRRNETIYSCIKVIRDAADCDILLISGDVFDYGDVSTAILDSFLHAITELGDIPVFYSCGNHDSYYSNAVSYCLKNSPHNLYIFPPDALTYYQFDSMNLRVYGASFATEQKDTSMLESAEELDKSYINILCMHGDDTKGVYNYIDTSKLADIGFDYAALGHIHSFSGIQKTDTTYWAYPGVHDGRGFDECGDKGYIKGTIFKGSVQLNYISSSSRIYLDEKIDISDFKNEYELIDVINSLCPNGNEISRFTLIGDNNFGKSIDTAFVVNNCKSFHAECIDNTVIALSAEDYIGFPGLKGACASETVAMLEKLADDQEKEKIKKAFGVLIEIFENR